MAKNFFQDMIRVKSEIRKEMEAVPALRKEMEREVAPPEVKKIPVNVPKPRPPESAVPPPAPLANQAVPPKVENTYWAPMVENKVTRQADVGFTQEKKRRGRYSLWIVAGASLVFLFFAVSFLFAKATVTVTPKVAEVSLNENFIAIKDTSSGTNISFDLISLPGEEVRTVQGGAIEDVALPAKGTVIIYNNYSSAPQRLDINTRLEGSNGKIYKTVSALTVPGMKGTTPGSVEVNVYAAEPGESYNSSPLDFQIFGFKGTPKYGKFYARSKGELSGGLVGKVSSIPDNEKALIVDEMRGILEAKLLERARDLIPEGFVLLENAVTFRPDGETFGPSAEGSVEVPVTVRGTLTGYLFDEKELAEKVASTTIEDYDGGEVFISNLKDLQFSLVHQDSPGSEARNITFNLSGDPKIVWVFDEEGLTAELLGKSKADFNQILAKYPNIESADMVLRPMWRRSFPVDKEDLEVTINYPNSNE